MEPRPQLGSSSLPIFIWAWLIWEIQAPAAQRFPRSLSEGRHRVLETDRRVQLFLGGGKSFLCAHRSLAPVTASRSMERAPLEGLHGCFRGCLTHLPPAHLLRGSAKQMPEAASLKPAPELALVCRFHRFSRGGTCKRGTIQRSKANAAAAAAGPWVASNAVLEMKCAGKKPRVLTCGGN